MANFKYRARAGDGKNVEGTLTANDEGEAAGTLRKQNLVILSIEAQNAPGGGFKLKFLSGPPKPRVNTGDMAIFTRQLSTMISAGIPLLESLEILEEQADDPGFKVTVAATVARVRAGSDFSDALSDHPKLFTRVYVSMVRAGEASGQLDTILKRLAEYMEASEALKREIKSAMTYPTVSLGLILCITIALLVFIVPKFKDIFTSMGVELPLITAYLLATSDFMREYFFLWIGAAVGAYFAFLAYTKTPVGERMWHAFLLKVPVFGPLFKKVAISRFARTFSTLIQSGVPILGALEIVANTAGNRVIEDAVNSARESVRKGDTLGEPLAKSKQFPPMVTRMISIGEKSGSLEQLLEKISEFYDQQVKASVKALTSLIEPMMIAVMGCMVGGIVLAIFLPILKIQEAVRPKH
ncbi:MAG: type II secretion system inner membrane protein GspF [Planctomycetes bacterium]|nr:type II secretion system inner membrane protein GspF [Planctomycetota bacterium]